jgi:hypothetical protein
MAVDAMLHGSQETQEQAQGNLDQTGQANQEGTQAKEDNLVPLLKVDEKDAEFVSLVQSGLTPNQAAIQIASARDAQQGNINPNAASGVAGGSAAGGTAGEGSQQSVLESQYQERLAKIPQGDWKALGNLKDEFRKNGLEKW